MEENVYKLPAIMENMGEPSLKAISIALGLNPVRIYSVAKTPKEGEIYDAKKYNWEAVERFCVKRLSADKGYATLEELIELSLKLDVELQSSDRRRTTGVSTKEMIVVDGRDMPARKFANFEADYAGELPHPAGVHCVLLKKDNNVYGIVHQTRGYTVLQPIGEDGEFCKETIKVLSNTMLNLQGFGINSYTAEDVANKYAAQAKAAADADANATEG